MSDIQFVLPALPTANNECESLPCQNGGTCLEEDPGYYVCDCVGDFFGQNCQFNLGTCKLLIQGPLINLDETVQTV